MSERSEGEVPLLVELGAGSDGSAGQWNEEWDEGAQEEGQNQRTSGKMTLGDKRLQARVVAGGRTQVER